MAIDAPIKHPNEWSVVPLGSIALKVGSGSTPRGGEETYLPERMNYALVRSQNVFDRYFDPAGLAFISDQQADLLKGVVLQPEDLLLNITGDGVTFARCCPVPADILPACVNQHVAIIRLDPKLADPGYVLSYLTHPSVKSYIESFNAGGSRRAITKGHIESFRISLPPLGEQQRIAQILGTLDNKIALNWRLKGTLEAISRALFKSWFVDFDPVKAKMQNRDLGIPKSIADLYPSSLENSELGQIPVGWKNGTLGDVVELLRSQEDPLSFPETTFQHYSIPAFDNGQWSITELGANIKSLKFKVPAGVILLSKLNPEIERVWLVDVHEHDRAVCSTEFLVLSPRAPFGRNYAYCLARSSEFRQQIESLVTGTSKSHQRAQADAVLRLPVVLPPKSIVGAFETFSSNFLERVIACRRESRTLAGIRDALQPRLMSGEIRVPKVKETVGGQV